MPKSQLENNEFVLESQRWLTFSPLMAANITKLVSKCKCRKKTQKIRFCHFEEYVFILFQVVIQGVSSVQVAEGLDSLSLDLIRTKRRPKVSIKDFWSKS